MKEVKIKQCEDVGAVKAVLVEVPKKKKKKK